jgi:hypothetical protein
VYNRDSTFDPEVLKKLRKRNTTQDFAEPPTRDELKEAIKKMNGLAAPGKSGLSPTAMKNLSEEHKDELLVILQRYWSRTDANPEWNKSILRWIYKGKGKNTSDPNNYRGICLQEVVARYLSSILLNTRLLNSQERRIGNPTWLTTRTRLQRRSLHSEVSPAGQAKAQSPVVGTFC